MREIDIEKLGNFSGFKILNQRNRKVGQHQQGTGNNKKDKQLIHLTGGEVFRVGRENRQRCNKERKFAFEITQRVTII